MGAFRALMIPRWLLLVAVVVLAAAGRAQAQYKLSPTRCALLSGKDRELCDRYVSARDSFTKFATANEWARYQTASCELGKPSRGCSGPPRSMIRCVKGLKQC